MRTLLLHIMAVCLLFGQVREIGWAVEVVSQPVVRLGRGAITDIDWSPDDRWFVTTGQAGTVQLWDNWYGTKVRDIVGHTGTCLNVGFGPDGTWVWSLANDATFRRWDVATGRQLSCMPVVRNPGSCNVNSSGTLLVVTNRDWPSNAYIYNLTSETLATSFTMITHHDLCRSMFGPNSSRLEVQDDEYILDYDWAHGAFLNYRRGFAQRFEFAGSDHLLMGLYGVLDTDASTQSTVLSPVGTTLHASYLSQTNSGAWWIKHTSGDASNYWLHVANLSGPADERIIPGIADEGVRMKASSDGKMIYFAGKNGHVYAWDIATGALVRDFDVQNGEFSSVQLSPDGSRAVTVETDGRWCLYRLPDGEMLRQGMLMPDPPPAVKPAFGVRFALAGQRMALFSSTGVIRFVDTLNPDNGQSLFLYGSTLKDVQFSPSGNRFALLGTDMTYIYATEQMQLLKTISGTAYNLFFWAEDRLLRRSSTTKEFDVNTGQVIRTIPFPAPSETYAPAPDGIHLLAIDYLNYLRLWNVPASTILWQWQLPAPLTFVAVSGLGFTPDSGRCWVLLNATAEKLNFKQELLLLNGATGATVLSYDIPGSGAALLATSADGRYVAAANEGFVYVYAAPQNSADGAWGVYE